MVLDVTNLEVPAHLGLVVLYADTVTDRLVNRVVTSKEGNPLALYDASSLRLVRNDSHVYATMIVPHRKFFTKDQLRKFHKQFITVSINNTTKGCDLRCR